MKAKTLSAVFKAVIILLAVFGAAMCAAWYPLRFRSVLPSAGEAAFWTMLSLSWLASLPCFAMLAIGWKLSVSVKKDEFFTLENSSALKKCAIILLADLAFFAASNLGFWAARWQSFDAVVAVIFVLGLVLAALALAASYLVNQAAGYKQESEGLI